MSIIDSYLRRSKGIDDLLDQVVALLPLLLCEHGDILGLKQLTRGVSYNHQAPQIIRITLTRNADAKVANTLRASGPCLMNIPVRRY